MNLLEQWSDHALTPGKLLPECAVCGKPVESASARRWNHKNAWELVVHCHGDTESVTVDMKEAIVAQNYGGIRLGRAFEHPRMLP